MSTQSNIYPKSKETDLVYYVKKLNYSFSMLVLDPSGNRIQAKNEATGLPLFNHKGEPVYIEDHVRFTPWKTRFAEEGYVAIYVVTETTPKAIAEMLKKDAADRTCEIMDENTYIKSINPDLYDRMQKDAQKDRALESEKKKNVALEEEIARMRERLQARKS